MEWTSSVAIKQEEKRHVSSTQNASGEEMNGVCCIATQLVLCGRKDKWIQLEEAQGWELPTFCVLFWCCCPFFIISDGCLSCALCCAAVNKNVGVINKRLCA